MKLENQVCSIELARMLKELGVKQESHWYWLHNISADFDLEGVGKIVKDWVLMHIDGIKSHRGLYSAFTAAELGEILPPTINVKEGDVADGFYGLYITKGLEGKYWFVRYVREPYIIKEFNAETEVNARAKMLIYLLKNNEIIDMEI